MSTFFDNHSYEFWKIFKTPFKTYSQCKSRHFQECPDLISFLRVILRNIEKNFFKIFMILMSKLSFKFPFKMLFLNITLTTFKTSFANLSSESIKSSVVKFFSDYVLKMNVRSKVKKWIIVRLLARHFFRIFLHVCSKISDSK